MVSADYIQQGLVQRGLPAHIAQGFVMNMRDESGLNPGINERTPLVPGSRGGYGLYQLTGPRRRAYESYASNRGVSFENADAQLDFLMAELQGPEKRAAQSIFSTNNPQDAAVAIARDFLRPAASNLQKRVASYTGGSSPKATTGTQGAAPMMQQEQKPRGLLGSLGIQKMEEGAEGETGQRFYQRDSFKDTAAILAQGFGRMGIMGMEEIADSVAKQRTEAKARNKTAEYLRANGRGDLADMIDQGLIGGREAAGVLLQKPKEKVRQVRGSEIGLTGPQADRLFNVSADNKVTAIGGTAPVTNINMGDKVSPGLKKLDESFAETYSNLSMSGLADARSQAATINTVLEKLESGEQLTGPLIGAQPDFLRAITNPDAQDAIDRVGSVVQRSLREVLGGQFAQREGEQLVRRAYNPSLPPAQNAARLRALFAVLDQTAKNKMDMATYYQGNDYSLGGYKGNLGLPSAEDLYAAMDAAAAPLPSEGSGATVINGYTIQKVETD